MREFLDTAGEWIHHIPLVITNMEKKIKVLEERGYPVIQTGNFFNGKGRYAYMDTTSTYKVIIELLKRIDTKFFVNRVLAKISPFMQQFLHIWVYT
jgi:hypothetical protein